MKNNHVVVDGGTGKMKAIPETYSRGAHGPVKLNVLRVRENGLKRIYPSHDQDKGTMYVYEDGQKDGIVGTFAFAVLPRKRSSQLLPFNRKYFHSKVLKTFLGIQSNDSTEARGQKRKLFFDEPVRRVQKKNCYPSVGPKASRGARGVTEYSHHAKSNPVAYKGATKLAGILENAWNENVPRDEVCRVKEAYDLCPWPTLRGLDVDSPERHIFSGANLSSGCYHNAHTDNDYEYSALFTFDPWKRTPMGSDEIVRWFAFPQ